MGHSCVVNKHLDPPTYDEEGIGPKILPRRAIPGAFLGLGVRTRELKNLVPLVFASGRGLPGQWQRCQMIEDGLVYMASHTLEKVGRQ